MTLLSLPTRWLGTRSRASAIAAILLGVALMAFAIPAWASVNHLVATAGSCATDAASVTTCDRDATSGVVWSLLGPGLAIAGAFAIGAGLACLARPRGRLEPAGERLLTDATRFVAAGALSVEGFQATRDRLHAQAARRDGPQAALSLLVVTALLALTAFVMAISALDMLSWLHGAATARAPLAAVTRNLAFATSAATVALAVRGAYDARLLRRRANQEDSRVHAMLRELETDVLDEVRRSNAHRGLTNMLQPAPEPALRSAGEAPLAWRPAP